MDEIFADAREEKSFRVARLLRRVKGGIFSAAFVATTVGVSLATKPVPDAQLTGLVYGMTEIPSVGDVPLYQKPLFWAAVVTVIFLLLNIIFW